MKGKENFLLLRYPSNLQRSRNGHSQGVPGSLKQRVWTVAEVRGALSRRRPVPSDREHRHHAHREPLGLLALLRPAGPTMLH